MPNLNPLALLNLYNSITIELNIQIIVQQSMQHKKQRERLCTIGHRIWQQGLSPGTAGNISLRLSANEILISPTQTSMGFMEPENICLIDLEGNIKTEVTKPSSEYKLHLFVYMNRPEIKAVIHAHPPYASAFAVAGKEPSTFIQPETFVFLGKVPVVKYGTPSTDELSDNLAQYLVKDLKNFLLQNHGVLCIGEDLERTYFNLETLENLAKVTVIAQTLGGEKEISKKNIQKLAELFNVKVKI
jgi:L-fuculose-phosphate aldolase